MPKHTCKAHELLGSIRVHATDVATPDIRQADVPAMFRVLRDEALAQRCPLAADYDRLCGLFRRLRERKRLMRAVLAVRSQELMDLARNDAKFQRDAVLAHPCTLAAQLAARDALLAEARGLIGEIYQVNDGRFSASRDDTWLSRRDTWLAKTQSAEPEPDDVAACMDATMGRVPPPTLLGIPVVIDPTLAPDEAKLTDGKHTVTIKPEPTPYPWGTTPDAKSVRGER